jgi:DnaK suppressor protein
METIDFQEFEVRLQEMKDILESDILSLKDEMEIIVLEDNIDDMADMASLESDCMHHRVLLKQQQHELDEVNHALSKIKNKTYGVSEDSGEVIPIERLRAEPHTRYCLKDIKKMQK